MATVKFQVERLEGYTDGRPSWGRMLVGRAVWSRETAEEAARKLRENQPSRKFRVRKVTRKR